MANIFVGGAVIALVGLIIYRMRAAKQKNPYTCYGSGCSSCPYAEKQQCHK